MLNKSQLSRIVGTRQTWSRVLKYDKYKNAVLNAIYLCSTKVFNEEVKNKQIVEVYQKYLSNEGKQGRREREK